MLVTLGCEENGSEDPLFRETTLGAVVRKWVNSSLSSAIVEGVVSSLIDVGNFLQERGGEFSDINSEDRAFAMFCRASNVKDTPPPPPGLEMPPNSLHVQVITLF